MSGHSVHAKCLVCGIETAEISYFGNGDVHHVECIACGDYVISGSLTAQDALTDSNWWTPVRRAALAHVVRTRRDLPLYKSSSKPLITSIEIASFQESGISLPSRLVQLDNLVRHVGDYETEHGSSSGCLPDGLWALIGAASRPSLNQLIDDLVTCGLLSSMMKAAPVPPGLASRVSDPRLTIDGWQRWEALRKGETRSRDGFIAMQFSDDYVGAFIRDTVQASIERTLEVKVHRIDSPDKMQAGLIDNIMREAIEDAAFVLVELSHGNRGAYWEAGLAEGLGKPVIYLCEQEIWESADRDQKPHFDVRHRQTVMWNRDDPEACIPNLVATIKNSLRNKYN